MKLEILSDPKKELENLPKLIKLVKGDWLLTEEIKKDYNNLSSKELLKKITKSHKENKEKIKRLEKYCHELWEKSKERYLKEIENIFGHKIGISKKVFLVTSIWINIADVVGGKNAFIVAEKNQEDFVDFIFLHEITHLFYSDELRKYNLGEAGDSPLMEGVAHLILFKTPILELFNSMKYNEVGFIKKNPKFMKALEEVWSNRKDFKSFLKEAIKINKKRKPKHPLRQLRFL